MPFKTVLFSALLSVPAFAVTIGQTDTFQSGVTLGWTAGGGPLSQFPPVPPAVVLTGGPAGAGDAYLRITAQGGDGPGSRLTAFNIFGQWAGNYLASGIGAISLNLNNFGQTQLSIRLEFENPFSGGDFAVTNTAVVLPPGSGWTTAVFPVAANQLTALSGTAAGTLANTSILRILHASGPTAAEPVAGVLGVDNITALAAIPEPSTLLTGALALALLARRLSLRR